jgi:uncharacterized protein YkwD
MHLFFLQKLSNLLAISLLVCGLALPLSSFAQEQRVYSISEGEEVIAGYFHELLNGYRLKKKKGSVAWSTLLQTAAYNHTQWMVDANKLTHTESRTGSPFTGKTVLERIQFACQKKGSFVCGENVLFFSCATENKWAISDTEAKQIAQLAFEYWKASKGHNENMLYNYTYHGAAFIYSQGYIWSTSVFSGAL